MTVLTDAQRRTLDRTVQRARSVSEAAAGEAVSRLAVDRESRPGYLTTAENDLRLALREKARLLGDETGPKPDLKLLIGDIAYEQWHRLLFARFLEVNKLLRHPDVPDVPLSMDDCAELAAEEGEPDGWSVAARYAEAILPGVFRSSDPAVRLRFSPERRTELDAIVAELDRATLIAEDALGWVYQFWQTTEKKRVNDSGRKIGGADLAPVTQLFTENYMVRFLLENSLGAWWAGRHPNSPLLAEWEFLRRLDDGTPAAGTFEEWPKAAAEVTVMDPCCGSGHFLVATFGMLWQMRAEEEGLPDADAQDAVLRDNLFGLELDPRCTQIAAFNVVLEAWKQGGFRHLPTPQIACSGISIKASREDWEKQVHATPELKPAMTRLHSLFRDADSLGSLIDPLLDPDDALVSRHGTTGDTWPSVAVKVLGLLSAEAGRTSLSWSAAKDIADAAHLLARRYTLVTTNPPFLKRAAMSTDLQEYVDAVHPAAKGDLATALIERASLLLRTGGSLAIVSPQNWLLLSSYRVFREQLLDRVRLDMVARLGSGSFRQITGEVVKVALSISSSTPPPTGHQLAGILAHRISGIAHKSDELAAGLLVHTSQESQRVNPDCRITLTELNSTRLLEASADGLAGIQTGDYPRFGRVFWERPLPHAAWEFQQSTVSTSATYSGREHILRWDQGFGQLHEFVAQRLGTWGVGAWIRGTGLTGKRGIAVSQMGDLPVTLYTGELFDNNTAVILPRDPKDLPAIWAYCSSPEFRDDVRELDDKMNVTNATLVKVSFDREHWQRIADVNGPLPGLRKGRVSAGEEPFGGPVWVAGVVS